MNILLLAEEAAKLARDYPQLTIQEAVEIAKDIFKESNNDEN